MVSHLFYYQLALCVLVWLFVMLVLGIVKLLIDRIGRERGRMSPVVVALHHAP